MTSGPRRSLSLSTILRRAALISSRSTQTGNMENEQPPAYETLKYVALIQIINILDRIFVKGNSTFSDH